MTTHRKPNRLRIIAGTWRGRKLTFPDTPELRPSPDRVRETLFNWLAPVIEGARCLDLFAGSGALGFEALSRGAHCVTFVDTSSEVISHLHTTLQQLSTTAEILKLNATKPFTCKNKPFDIVFLDPPFHQNLLEPVC